MDFQNKYHKEYANADRLPDLFPSIISDSPKNGSNQQEKQSTIHHESDYESSNEEDSAHTTNNQDAVEKRKRGRPRKKENINETVHRKGSMPQKSPRIENPRNRPKEYGDSVNSNYDAYSSMRTGIDEHHGEDPNANASTGLSVRSIPCFYADCTYSYKRPGSNLTEISDRPLVFSNPKFDGYTIRSCKKHYEKWKGADTSAQVSGVESCEVCRGLNAGGTSDMVEFTNNRGRSFLLCEFCSHRQASMLEIKPPAEMSEANMKRSAKRRRESDDDHDTTVRVYSTSDSESDYQNSDKDESKNSESSSDERIIEDEEDELQSANALGNTHIRREPVPQALSTIDKDKLQKERENDDDEYRPHDVSTSKKKSGVGTGKYPRVKGSGKKSGSHSANNNKKRKVLLSAPVINYALYRRNIVSGWELVPELTYSSSCVWDDAVAASKPPPLDDPLAQSLDGNNNSNIIMSDQDSPFSLSIRKINEKEGAQSVGVFMDTEIAEGQTIGEYVGKVIDRKSNENGDKTMCYAVSADLEIDSNSLANEVALINEESGLKEPNIRFDYVNGRILAVTLRKIDPNEELISDYSRSEYRNRESSYFEVFTKIDEFNRKHLTDDERNASAFQWFIDDGYEILKAKGKITVPIGNRIPSKKGLASNLAPRKFSHVTKDQSEWGYVAQYEMLDLERAREDCWVTFKAGKNLSYEDLDVAIRNWRSNPQVESTTVKKESFPALTGSTSSSSVTSAPVHSRPHAAPPKERVKREERHHAPKVRKIKEKHVDADHGDGDKNRANTREVLNINKREVPAQRTIQEISFKDLSVKFDAERDLLGTGKTGYVFKGYWRGYPVAIRFPIKPTEEIKQRFISQCESLMVVAHPNLLNVFGCCIRDQVCSVMEFMNLGNLKKYIMSLAPVSMSTQRELYMQHHIQFHGMYIPRIALDIVRGLEYLHSKKIVHRNLKSSNVLMKGEILDNGLIANMEVKISEYGLDNDTFIQFPPREMDYLYYYAPEVIETKKHSFQSDIYSFGMILCHLFSEGQEKPKQPQVVIQTSPFLQMWDPKWKELIQRCTSRDPVRRPNCSEIMDLLLELLSSANRDFI